MFLEGSPMEEKRFAAIEARTPPYMDALIRFHVAVQNSKTYLYFKQRKKHTVTLDEPLTNAWFWFVLKVNIPEKSFSFQIGDSEKHEMKDIRFKKSCFRPVFGAYFFIGLPNAPCKVVGIQNVANAFLFRGILSSSQIQTWKNWSQGKTKI